MIYKKGLNDYWFIIEPYVYVALTRKHVLLYNTLDGEIVESKEVEVFELLQEVLQKKNNGVILLSNKKIQEKNISAFIEELREKHMGDIIDISLSKSKPVQLLPFFNLIDANKSEIYKKHNFSSDTNILNNLYEICIHVDHTTEIDKLIPFIQSIPKELCFNIIGNIKTVKNHNKLLSFFNQQTSSKNIICSYTDVLSLQSILYENNFSYKILVDLPIDMQLWNHSRLLLLKQTLPFEYIFRVTSVKDCQFVEQFIEQFEIECFNIKPVYTGENINFFEENVFLTKEDILGAILSIKDIFMHQAINVYDFGKINIMPNGDVYANENHAVLGNICTHSVNEMIHKEIEIGNSWFRIRNQAPCSDCVYQWLCPSLSDFEIFMGRSNLCKIQKNK